MMVIRDLVYSISNIGDTELISNDKNLSGLPSHDYSVEPLGQFKLKIAKLKLGQLLLSSTDRASVHSIP